MLIFTETCAGQPLPLPISPEICAPNYKGKQLPCTSFYKDLAWRWNSYSERGTSVRTVYPQRLMVLTGSPSSMKDCSTDLDWRSNSDSLTEQGQWYNGPRCPFLPGLLSNLERTKTGVSNLLHTVMEMHKISLLVWCQWWICAHRQTSMGLTPEPHSECATELQPLGGHKALTDKSSTRRKGKGVDVEGRSLN